MWLSRTRLYFAKVEACIGIERGLILPYTWLSETRRNVLDELYFLFDMHVFGLDLNHADLSSCISYLFRHLP